MKTNRCLAMLMLLFTITNLVSCASAPMTKEMKEVRILSHSDAGKNCKEISNILITTGMIFNQQERINNMKRRTYEEGGDTFVKTSELQGSPGSFYGTVYKCR